MKAILGGMILSGVLLSSTAMAGWNGASANSACLKQPAPMATRQEACMARRMPDNSPVMLEGFIVSHLGGKYYTFRDRSGKTRVEIDKRVWKGVEADSRTRVRVYGKIERQGGRNCVEAKRIELTSSMNM